MTFLSRFRYRASAAVVLAGVLMSSGCGGAQKSPRALTADEVTGTWTGEGGATVSISGDHRFSVDAQLGTGFLEKVGQTRTGSWKFVDLGGGKNSGVELVFPVAAEANKTPLPIDFVSQQDGTEVNLCLYGEPDKPCTGYILRRNA
ncbi:hypothetical protein ACIBJD_03470 [Kitasatospora sp. NPDC050467]|uniref:hypothetical protein n=1 Tax=Kitasatospora sp. NPDC050467 TaxID=3364053 RepID=UPI003798F55F